VTRAARDRRTNVEVGKTSTHAGAVDPIVRGHVSFPDGTPPLVGVNLRVILQDVTRADIPARTVSEMVLKGLSHAGGGTKVSFELRVDRIDPKTRYVVRAHVDVDGDGRVSKGDYVTTQSYPVLTFGHGHDVDVHLHRVGGE